MSDEGLIVAVAVSPLACLTVVGCYLQWQGWQIYHRMGNYSIGLVTFFTQLTYRGWNFPGPNMLEAQIAAQPADVQAQVQVFRRRMLCLRWGVLVYVGSFLLLGLLRKLSS